MPHTEQSSQSSPYSTGGGGVRLEHAYAACLIAAFLAGDAITELGDSYSLDSIRLQASDTSNVDDILLEGRDAHGELHRASIAVRRSPSLTRSDSATVPLFRDFLSLILDHRTAVDAGRWRLVLAVSTNAKAVTQIAELAELARSVSSAAEFQGRLAQPGRTNADIRGRYGHIEGLVERAADDLESATGVTIPELSWRLLSNLSVRSLHLERTDRTDRTVAVNALQRVLLDGTPATADALFSRIEELVGTWASQAAVLTQPVIRRSLSDYALARSPRFASAWLAIDRLGSRLRDSISPALRVGSRTLELERLSERVRVETAMRSVGSSGGSLVITGDPDIGKTALSLRVAEALRRAGAAVTTLSLRDLPQSVADFEVSLEGFSLDDVLAAGEARAIKLIVIDGAEAVLEGKAAMLEALSTAALKAGSGVVAVTRTDGSRRTADVLRRSRELVGTSTPPAELMLGPLTQGERNQLAATFMPLARLGSDGRTSWLLGRPGLVDALLRAGEELDPAALLCEADVFSTVWRSLIRKDEDRTSGTASPDDREQAALSVAKRSLGLPADFVPGSAAAELRSVGVTRSPNNPALTPGDEFSTDLFRDFALCRLLIREGWEILATAGAPRWAIRATRLGCQAALLTSDTISAWSTLSTQFSLISDANGVRWSEVPFEALLTLGNADAAIRELWDTLTKGDGAALATLLRLAEGRYVDGTVGDPFALAPIVRVAFCERFTVERTGHFARDKIRRSIDNLVLAWLRGLALSCLQPDGLRQAVRDAILAEDPPRYDAFSIEALATLGPDLDDRSDAWLRAVARDRPGSLHPAVESFTVSHSMSKARPDLLLHLAEAYYIELPNPRDRRRGRRELDDGIRVLNHGIGVDSPAAAWHYGPFFSLLNSSRPFETIGFINRMLDHAARFRVAKSSSYRDSAAASGDTEAVLLNIPGVGERRFVGDSHVWAWYRGTSVGPYACMSALLALERFSDVLLEQFDVPAQRIVELLLTDCYNLAVPGLVVGFLIRHPEAADRLLDGFLVSPAVWRLESARVTGDYGFRVRDPDADKLSGSDRRRYTFHEIVGEMVASARLTGDNERIEELELLGDRLVASARDTSSDTDSDYLAVAESWAAEFRIENYRTSSVGDRPVIYFERPEPLEQRLAPRNAELQTTNLLYGLQNRYGPFNDYPDGWPVDNLANDLTTARAIEADSSALEDVLWPEDALVSVAAAALHSHAFGLAIVSQSDLGWAAEAVLRAAESPRIDEMSHPESTFPMGADRAAAATVPLMLLAPFDGLDLEPGRVENALRALATSFFDEVRAIYVKGCAPLWRENCTSTDSDGSCRRHSAAWSAAVAGLHDCRLGPLDDVTGSSDPDPLLPPYENALPAIPDESLLVNRLRMPLSCMVDARPTLCLRDEVEVLWAPLWDAYTRGLKHWWEEGYDHQELVKHEPVARRMIEVALTADRDLVRTSIERLATNSGALHLLFASFATVFTYDDQCRSSMSGFWPWALEAALVAVGDGRDLRAERHWFDYMVAALMPTPTLHSWDTDIDSTLKRARRDWIQPEHLGALAGSWLQLARQQPQAVDAVIKFSKSAPINWQTTTALEWIETIIDERYDLIANHLYYLEDWLSEMRSAGVILGAAKVTYHRILDGLAAAGDRAGVRLQQLDE